MKHSAGILKLFRTNPNYKAFWYAFALNQFGDWFNLLASVSIAVSITGQPMSISLIFILRFLPQLILSPLGGYVSDKFDRIKIMMATNALQMVIAFSFLLVQSLHSIYLLYVLTFLQFGLNAIYYPASQSVLPQIVDKNHLGTANVIQGATWSSILIFGSLSGGMVTALTSVKVAFIIDGFSFLASIYFLSKITSPLLAPITKDNYSKSDLRAFFQAVKQNPHALIYTSLKPLGTLSWCALPIFEVIYSSQHPLFQETGQFVLGILYGVAGVGTALSPFIFRTLFGEQRVILGKIITICFYLVAVGILISALSSTLWVFVMGVLIRSIGSGAIWVFSSVLIQKSVDNKYLGKIFAIELALVSVTQIISMLWGGASISWFSLALSQAISVNACVAFCSAAALTALYFLVIRHASQNH